MDEDPLLAHGIPVIMNLVPHFTNSIHQFHGESVDPGDRFCPSVMSDQVPSSDHLSAQPSTLPRGFWAARWRRLAWPALPFQAWFLSAALHGSVLLMLGLLIQHIVKQTEQKGIAINAVGQTAEPLNDAPIGTPANLHPGFGSTDVDSAPLGESLGLSLEDVPAKLTLSGRTASAPGIDAVLA